MPQSYRAYDTVFGFMFGEKKSDWLVVFYFVVTFL
jgi:hypothetical protein